MIEVRRDRSKTDRRDVSRAKPHRSQSRNRSSRWWWTVRDELRGDQRQSHIRFAEQWFGSVVFDESEFTGDIVSIGRFVLDNNAHLWTEQI